MYCTCTCTTIAIITSTKMSDSLHVVWPTTYICTCTAVHSTCNSLYSSGVKVHQFHIPNITVFDLMKHIVCIVVHVQCTHRWIVHRVHFRRIKSSNVNMEAQDNGTFLVLLWSHNVNNTSFMHFWFAERSMNWFSNKEGAMYPTQVQ